VLRGVSAEVEVRSQYMSHMHFVQTGLTREEEETVEGYGEGDDAVDD